MIEHTRHPRQRRRARQERSRATSSRSWRRSSAPAPPFAPSRSIYVDDGSTDATAAELDEGAGHAAVAARRPSRRRVAARARRCARASSPRAAPIVVTLDGDGQNDPAFIPQLWSPRSTAARGSALAAGQRVGRKDGAFKKLAVAHRQRRARADPEGRHPRHRLRAEGVPPRRLSRAALFRRAAPLHAGAVQARGLRRRACGRGRSAAPCGAVELRPFRSPLGRHPRPRRRVVADPPPPPRSGQRQEISDADAAFRTISASTSTTWSSPVSISGLPSASSRNSSSPRASSCSGSPARRRSEA